MEDKKVNMIFSFKVKNGKQERYEKVLTEQLQITKNESGTLSYEIFKNEDGIYFQNELYVNEAACMTHVQNTAVQLQEWMELTEIQQLIALGPLSDEFKTQYQLKEHYLPYTKVNK